MNALILENYKSIMFSFLPLNNKVLYKQNSYIASTVVGCQCYQITAVPYDHWSTGFSEWGHFMKRIMTVV